MSTVQKGTVSKGTVSKGNIFPSELAFSGELTSVITSGGSVSVNENVDADTAVYTATARDKNGVTSGFSFAISTGDSSDFTINSSTGAVTIDASPNFEAQPSYSFTVTATKSGQPTATKDVTIAVNNLDDTAPTITSGATATAIAENSGAGQVIYTVTADDSSDVSGGVTFALSNIQSDSSLFSINSTTGAVTLTANPDFETKSSYTFAVVATDAAGNSSSPSNVTLAITNVADIVPTFDDGSTLTIGVARGISGSRTLRGLGITDSESTFQSFSIVSQVDNYGNTVDAFEIGNPPTQGAPYSIKKKSAYSFQTHSNDYFYTVVIGLNYLLAATGNTQQQTTLTLTVNMIEEPTWNKGSAHEIHLLEGSYTNTTIYGLSNNAEIGKIAGTNMTFSTSSGTGVVQFSEPSQANMSKFDIHNTGGGAGIVLRTTGTQAFDHETGAAELLYSINMVARYGMPFVDTSGTSIESGQKVYTQVLTIDIADDASESGEASYDFEMTRGRGANVAYGYWLYGISGSSVSDAFLDGTKGNTGGGSTAGTVMDFMSDHTSTTGAGKIHKFSMGMSTLGTESPQFVLDMRGAQNSSDLTNIDMRSADYDASTSTTAYRLQMANAEFSFQYIANNTISRWASPSSSSASQKVKDSAADADGFVNNWVGTRESMTEDNSKTPARTANFIIS